MPELTPEAPRYAGPDGQAPTTLRPCVVCTKPVPPMGFGDPDYAVCPLGDKAECLDRAVEKRARERAEALAAVGDDSEPDVAAKPSLRPSQARRTLLGQSSDEGS